MYFKFKENTFGFYPNYRVAETPGLRARTMIPDYRATEAPGLRARTMIPDYRATEAPGLRARMMIRYPYKQIYITNKLNHF